MESSVIGCADIAPPSVVGVLGAVALAAEQPRDQGGGAESGEEGDKGENLMAALGDGRFKALDAVCVICRVD